MEEEADSFCEGSCTDAVRPIVFVRFTRRSASTARCA